MGWLLSDMWAAGFFDGEGSVSIGRKVHKNGRVPQHDLFVRVTQKRRDPLDRLAEAYGGAVHRRPNLTGGCFGWDICGSAAERFLRVIQPHSIVKADVIQLALLFRATVGSVGHRLEPGVTEKRDELRRQVLAANRT